MTDAGNLNVTIAEAIAIIGNLHLRVYGLERELNRALAEIRTLEAARADFEQPPTVS